MPAANLAISFTTDAGPAMAGTSLTRSSLHARRPTGDRCWADRQHAVRALGTPTYTVFHRSARIVRLVVVAGSMT